MFIKEKVRYLENYIENLCEEQAFPGATFVLMDEKDSHIKCYGKSQFVPKVERLTENAIYDLASLTKVVATTTSIMMLIERGALHLGTLVSDILPRYNNNKVTVKHLLTHTSGHDADIDCKQMNKEQLIDAVYNNKVNDLRFEKQVLYSDIGFILLGFIIDTITGSYEKFAQENIFSPLNMTYTFFNPEDSKKEFCVPTEFCKMRNKIMKGIVHDEKSYVLGGVAGHAGLFSTARDLSNFVRMFLNYGEFNGQTILNKQTIELISKLHTDGLDDDRGLGWWVKGKNAVLSDFASDRTIYHSGFTGTSIIIDLASKKSFILLTNRVHPSRDNIKLISLRRNIHNIALTSIK
ncbi:MAG: hypothetical protein K0Q47_430 [Sedimentibacter sp.]|nr:hypothetical protein [Sedimentibacter sp.]